MPPTKQQAKDASALEALVDRLDSYCTTATNHFRPAIFTRNR